MIGGIKILSTKETKTDMTVKFLVRWSDGTSKNKEMTYKKSESPDKVRAALDKLITK